MFEEYSNLATLAVMFARVEAGRMGAKELDSEHILLGIIRTDPATMSAVAPALTRDAVRERASAWQAPAPGVPNSVDMPLSDDGKRICDRASSLAKDREDAFLRTEHLLLALTLEPSHAADILIEAGTEYQQAEQLVRDRLGAGQQKPEWSQQGDWAIEDRNELFG